MRCMKCGQELTAVVCGHCGFDHRNTSVHMLEEIEEHCPLFSIAGVTGVDEAEVDLITQYENGKECFQAEDYEAALRWLCTPARKGSPSAQVLVGQIFELSDMYAGQEKALYWYEQAAARGNIPAIRILIRHYETVTPADEMERVRFKQRLERWREKLQESGSSCSAEKECRSQDTADFEISGTTLVKYRGREPGPVIPEGITVIGENAFAHNDDIRRLRLPESVTTIGKAAFQCCKYLEQVRLPDTLTTIEECAFWGCVNLQRISIPSGIDRIAPYAFFSCKALKELEIPGNVVSVEREAFRFCDGLRRVILRDGVQRLADHAFSNSFLEAITIPNTVCQIGDSPYTSAFELCPRLKTVHASKQWKEENALLLRKLIPFETDRLNFSMVKTKLMRYWGRGAEPVIPVGTTEIGPQAFMWNTWVRRIVIPEGVEVIREFAFWQCTAEEIVFPESLRKIDNHAFGYCRRIRKIKLPAGISDIPTGAFEYCSSLGEILIPGSVRTIGDRAFSFCDQLKKVVIASGVRQIGSGAFRYCSGLEEVEIPDSVEAVAANAFEEDDELRSFQASSQWKVTNSVLISTLPRAAR